MRNSGAVSIEKKNRMSAPQKRQDLKFAAAASICALGILAAALDVTSKSEQTLYSSEEGVWHWAAPEECDATSVASVALEVSADVDERAAGRLRTDELSKAVRKCGVAALVDVLPRDLVDELLHALEVELAPLLESRSRVRTAVQAGPLDAQTLERGGTEGVLDEPLLAAGHRYRERDAGRIDLSLPWRHPFNVRSLTANPLLLSVLIPLLGRDFELKSMHALYALPRAPDQSWHRDAPLLFAQRAETEEQRAKPFTSHVSEPSYALNVFLPLVDINDESAGPTEFCLRSHVWSEQWTEELHSSPQHRVQFHVGAGSAVIADYRTVHRGLANLRATSRPVLMLIYGRRWWTDPVNYGASGLLNYVRRPCSDPVLWR